MAKLAPFTSLSIIVPTINEAEFLPLLLADLNLYPYQYELIIVDGGSTDLTKLIAQLGCAKIINLSECNRGKQLHNGAKVAVGEWLLFLHADCRLSSNWGSKVNKIIKDPLQKKYAWFFDLKVKSKDFIWSIFQIAISIRSNLLKRPYGDQGLLISKDLYTRIGGYKEIALMEDLDMVLRLNKSNSIKALGIDIETSTRKYKNKNVLSIAIKNAILRAKWKKGESIKNLAEKYYSRD